MLKVLTVFGTRPEAIKLAPVLRELARQPGVRSTVCVTGQHRQMLDQVLNLFGIVPDHDLNLMQPNQSLSALAARIFDRLAPVVEAEAPDWVLVQGDTTTVMAASLVAYHARCRVGHVEAGLRTDDKWQPFPEELNRRVASVVADLHFAPTAWARDNLLREGVPDGRIAVTGNPGLDALQWALALPFDPSHDPLAALPPDRRILLVTAHRRENQAHIGAICAALRRLAARGDVHVVYPVHLNPNIHEPVLAALGDAPHVSLLAPLGYQPLVRLMQHSALVLTDSGGIQEEAPALGKPVLVLRDVTERPEGVAAGTARLVGPHEEAIVAAATRLLDDPAAYEAMARAVNPYGDGHAAERIMARLLAEGAHG